MKISRISGGLSLTLEEAEMFLLSAVIRTIGHHYETGGRDLDEAEKRHWNRDAALDASFLDEEDKELWRQSHQDFRSGRVDLCKKWLGQLEGGRGNGVEWEIPAAEWDDVLTVLNDHRMFLAAKFAISEADMETPLEEVRDLDRLRALVEINFLAYLMETLLPFVQGK